MKGCTWLAVILVGMALVLAPAAPAHAQRDVITVFVDIAPDQNNPAYAGRAFRLRGWAGLTSDCATGPNIDSVHIYLDGPAGTGFLLGNIPVTDRPDVARSQNCPGWVHSAFDASVTINTAGDHTLYIYGFDSRRALRPAATWPVAVQPPTGTPLQVRTPVPAPRPTATPVTRPTAVPTLVPAVPSPPIDPQYADTLAWYLDPASDAPIDVGLIPALELLIGVPGEGNFIAGQLDQTKLTIAREPLSSTTGGLWYSPQNQMSINSVLSFEDTSVAATYLAHEFEHVYQSTFSGSDPRVQQLACVGDEVSAYKYQSLVWALLWDSRPPSRTTWERGLTGVLRVFANGGEPALYAMVSGNAVYQEQCNLYVPGQ
ncbi:MAG: hypothetical protein QOF51_2136 [Chloroflexota bacterium]|nr:hypothetical protein [Chloroflexota bacterium]